MIKIGDIDIGKVIIELQFQSQLNRLLIENILHKTELSQTDIEGLKVMAADLVNQYYGGKQMITYTPLSKREETEKSKPSKKQGA